MTNQGYNKMRDERESVAAKGCGGTAYYVVNRNKIDALSFFVSGVDLSLEASLVWVLYCSG